MRVLNVGGGPSRELPPIYKGWDQVLLDADPDVKPDIVCDAKDMSGIKPSQFDAVYSSHTLEHFYKHEIPIVLAGFKRVLKKTGFIHVSVPDMNAVFESIAKGGRDIDDVWYNAGPHGIAFHDVIYGWGDQVGKGNLLYSHKCGFTQKSLARSIFAAGFKKVFASSDDAANLIAYAFKDNPKPDLLRRLGCR